MQLPRAVHRAGIMAVVAVIAIVTGGVIMIKRREAYRIRAAFHASQEQVAAGRLRHWSDEAAQLAGSPGNVNPAVADHNPQLVLEMVNYSRNRVAHHRRLKDKYERAARYAWLRIDPDPPSPDGVTPP